MSGCCLSVAGVVSGLLLASVRTAGGLLSPAAHVGGTTGLSSVASRLSTVLSTVLSTGGGLVVASAGSGVAGASVAWGSVAGASSSGVEELGTGHGVGLGVAPLVESNTGVLSAVETGNLHSGAKFSSTRGLDVELEALHVELGLSNVTLVDSNVLDADKVFTSGDLVLDGPLEPVLLPAVPGSVDARSAGVGEATLHDLGPFTTAIVVGNLSRSRGDVDESRTGVLNLLVEEELEANLVTSLDSVGGSAAGLGSLVAAEVGRVDNVVGERGHVRVGVLTGVGVVTTDGLVVDGQNVEDVVGIGSHGRRKQSEERTSLHVGSEKRELNIFKRNECGSE